MTSKKIGIIGAGIAGISCAKFLSEQGHEVTIFEKSRGIGGRMSHRIFNEWEADHGAQYFTAQDPQFLSVLQEWLNHELVKPWTGKIISLQNGQIKELKKATPRYVGIPSMNSPIKWLARNLTIHYLHTVTAIKKNANYWQLETTEQGKVQKDFDYLILAIPPQQVAPLVKDISEQVYQECSSAKMSPCWTLLSYFKSPVPLPYDAAFLENNIFSWIARDNSKPLRPRTETWVAQTNAEWSEEMINIPKPEVEKILAEHFYQITSVKSGFQQIHLWRYARLAQESTLNYLIDKHNNLGICGDWLRSSRVEDAWLSGKNLAEAFLT
jgi:predicted NAD/FAD-dependent oxidoreductase